MALVIFVLLGREYILDELALLNSDETLHNYLHAHPFPLMFQRSHKVIRERKRKVTKV